MDLGDASMATRKDLIVALVIVLVIVLILFLYGLVDH
jgi:preprotein translocase subunit SecE